MGRGMEHPGAPQQDERGRRKGDGDDLTQGAESGRLERYPAYKGPSLLVVVATSPFRGSTVAGSDGIARVLLHGPEDVAKLSDTEFEAHVAAVKQSAGNLSAQQQIIDADCERRKEDRQRQMVADRDYKLAEKMRLEKEIAEIEAALAVMDSPEPPDR